MADPVPRSGAPVTTVAVCIPTIPPRRHLLESRALPSVMGQSHPADEVIVEVDREGTGAGPTRNRAWQRASSDYVAFLDDDDEFFADHLKLLLAAADEEDADLVYPWFELFDDETGLWIEHDPLACPGPDGDLVSPLGVTFGPAQAEHLRKYAFIPATVMVRRTMLERVGGYPAHETAEYEQAQGWEDWAFLHRLLDADAKFVHVPHRTWRLHLGVGTAGKDWTAT